jgi:hypothetical protein
MKQHSNRLFLLAICTAAFLAAGSARAALAPMTFSPTPADLGDLDHHLVYTWRIDNINLNNISVTGATLTFKNIANWDSNTNMLFAWLLDTSVNSGVATVQDVDASQSPVTSIVDAFLSPISLVSNSTAKTKLFQQSFGTTGHDFTYTFTAAQLQALTAYINSGHDIAFGFDPDCHFFNDGIIFTMNVVPIPEVANILPIAGLLIGAGLLEIRRRRRVGA